MMANLLNYIVWDPDPVLANLGPISIRYYATCWMVGLLLGYLMMHRLYKEQKLGEDKFEPLFIYLFVASWRVPDWDTASSTSRNTSSPSGITW